MRPDEYYETEPFELYPELDSYEFLDAGLTGETWAGEVNRKNRHSVRWVQRSLNRIMGLRLPVDGFMGPQTRSAIRDLQRRYGIMRRSRGGPPGRAALANPQLAETADWAWFDDPDEPLEFAINADKAAKKNNTLMHSLGWVDHFDRIAQNLLGFKSYSPDDLTFAKAVADWQRQMCFNTADGIIGPVTWGEMKHLLGLAAPPTPRSPLPEVNVLLAKAALGYCAHKPQSHRFGLQETILALTQIGMLWFLKNPTGPRIRIADISRQGGGRLTPHVSHRVGLDVDIWLMRKDRKEQLVRVDNPAYDRALTQELVDTIRGNGVLDVKCIFLADRFPGVRFDAPHRNHMHVRFCLPSKYKTSLKIKAAYPDRKPAKYECPPFNC